MKDTYKFSMFNLIVDETSTQVELFNTYSLKYRRLEKYEYMEIKDKSDIDIGDVPEYLATEGFIVPSDLDEMQRIKDDAHAQQERANGMFLSIFTTLACNYRCVYCFEKDQLCQTEHMTLETADDILNFIKRQYANHKYTRPLKIKWFGGEPLLNIDIIRYISKELISNNIDFSAIMYTNGRLLTKEIAQELKELHLTGDVVIPLDGLAPTYAKLKNCREDDFYKVINNIKECEDILKIVIHINVSEASKDDAEPLMKLLKDTYDIKSTMIISPIAPQNTDTITDENNLNIIDLNRLKTAHTNRRNMGRVTSGCEARHPDYYVIGTQGELYICEHLVGQDKYTMGNIKEQIGRLDRKNTIWDNNKIVDDCKDCKILPICLGQCTSQRYIDNIDCNKDLRIKIYKANIKQIYS